MRDMLDLPQVPQLPRYLARPRFNVGGQDFFKHDISLEPKETANSFSMQMDQKSLREQHANEVIII